MLSQKQIKRIKAIYDFEQSINPTNQTLEDVIKLYSMNITPEREIVWFEKLIKDFKRCVKQYDIPNNQKPVLYFKLFEIRIIRTYCR